jgi:FkbM family methyltransferase
MNRQSLKKQYRNGNISKPDFIDAMYEQNEALFDYMNLLEETDIASIAITKDEVVFTSKTDGIKLSCQRPDKRTAPFEILNFDEYESSDATLLFRLIRNGQTVFDIGANIGWYSISLSKRFPNSTIYSFEPLKNTFDNLSRNVQINGSTNIKLHNFGFSNANQTLVFYSSPHTSVSNSAMDITGEKEATQVACLVKKLDDFLIDINTTVDFIKCDVEGAELFVYEGATKTLEKHKPIVFTEMLRKWSAKYDYHPNDIIELFNQLNYRCFVGEKDKLISIKEVTATTTTTNYFFLHREKHSNIIQQFSQLTNEQ